MTHAPPTPTAASDTELVARLGWLLRLRWLLVPIFVAVALAGDLLRGQPHAWTPLVIGGALLALNALDALLLARPISGTFLRLWARVDAALVVFIPAAIMLALRDASSALRYGVVVGVVGAAVVLPRTAEVAMVGVWAVAALVAADVAAAGFDPARLADGQVVRWAAEAGVIFAVSLVAGHLHQERARAAARAGALAAEAEESRREWGATFDDLAEMVIVTDLGGAVTRANQATARLLGARPAELVGRSLQSLLAGHPDRWWTATSDGVVEIEDPAFDTLFQVTVTRLPDRIVRVARDVGEPRRLYARLVQADKLAAVGVLATGVAHEINNPTAVITSNLTELRRYLQAYETALAELSAIGLESGSAERVKGVVQRGELAFARREAQTAIAESLQGMDRVRQVASSLRSVARRDQVGESVEPVPLAEVIEAVVRTAAHDLKAASARIDVRDPVQVLGHRGELVDVVLNLVVNAIQAKDEGRPNHVSVELRREGATALIRVSDTGKGIAAAHMKRLFEPFFTTKAPGSGTGLGLSLARNIVLAHGGSIDVQTEVGAGTTFAVRLPAHEPGAAPPAEKEGRVLRGAFGKGA